MAKLEAGTYPATIVDHGLFKSKKGSLGVNVTFKVSDTQHINWVGWMSGGATQYTVEALNKMGLDPTAHDVLDLSRDEIDSPIVLDTATVFELVLEDESYETDDGETKTVTKVKYVNLPGESPFEKVDKGELAAMIKKSGARTELAKLKGKARRNQTLGKNNAAESDIPF